MGDENRNGVVEADFGDATHRFRLAMAQLEELQEKTGLGPFVLLQRLMAGEWRVADVRETIRIGLTGGGMDPLAALSLVRRYIDDSADWIYCAKIAAGIVGAAIMGAPEEAPKKSDAPEGEMGAPACQTGALPSESFTASPPPLASDIPISAP